MTFLSLPVDLFSDIPPKPNRHYTTLSPSIATHTTLLPRTHFLSVGDGLCLSPLSPHSTHQTKYKSKPSDSLTHYLSCHAK